MIVAGNGACARLIHLLDRRNRAQSALAGFVEVARGFSPVSVSFRVEIGVV